MKRLLFLAMMLIVNLALHAQQEGVHPEDPAFVAKYANIDFNGKFVLLVQKDVTNNYFLVDFSTLTSRFERVYFMNLTFDHKEIVNIDPVINKSKVCFLVNRQYPENEVLKIFDQLKEKANNISGSWSAEKKSEWLTSNDKYK